MSRLLAGYPIILKVNCLGLTHTGIGTNMSINRNNIKIAAKSIIYYFITILISIDIMIVSDLIIHKTFFDDSVSLLISMLLWPCSLGLIALVVVITLEKPYLKLIKNHYNIGIFKLVIYFTIICMSAYISLNIIISKYYDNPGIIFRFLIIRASNVFAYYTWYISLCMGIFVYGYIKFKYLIPSSKKNMHEH